MKKIYPYNLIGAQCEAFFMHHKNGVFMKKDFVDHIVSKKFLMLNSAESVRLFDECIRLGAIASRNRRSFIITNHPITDWVRAVNNIKTTRIIKRHEGTAEHKPQEKPRDYINMITENIKSADTERLDYIQSLIDERRAKIKEEAEMKATLNSLVELANCNDAEELLKFIVKAKNL